MKLERYLRATVRFRSDCPEIYHNELIQALAGQGLVTEIESEDAVHSFKMLWPVRLDNITTDWSRFFLDPPDTFWVGEENELSEVMVRSAV